MSESNSARRSSGRAPKRKSFVEEDNSSKKTRGCEKTGCFANSPACCLERDLCTLSGYTSRWYHLSLGEHFCNNCFDNFYRTSKAGHQEFKKWCDKWTDVARATKPTLKGFVCNELLPYWVKCNQAACRKWRRVQKSECLDFVFIQKFTCSKDSKIKACDFPEDEDASLVLDPLFPKQLVEEPLLKNSVAAPFLHRFLSEDIGLCPLNCLDSVPKMPDNVKPFLLGQCGESSIWPKPDEADSEEMSFAKEFSISVATFLGLRNMIVTLWNMSPSQWLTIEKVNAHLVVRGLIRIYLLSVAEQMLDLLTKKGVINYGAIWNPTLEIASKNPQVLIVGAGISGLASAIHLRNLGVNVLICEARSKEGSGCDSNICSVKAGTMIVEGLDNNPFTILAHQTKTKYDKLNDNFVVFNSSGKMINKVENEKAQNLLNGLLTGAQEVSVMKKIDYPCKSTLLNNYEDMQAVSSSLSDLDIFKSLVARSEIKMKSDFRDLSLLSLQFILGLAGPDGIFVDGFNPILDKLAKELNIKYDHKVLSIDYTGDEVTVSTSKDVFRVPKVILSVPLPVLKDNSIKFNPDLPDFKKDAFEGLGNFYCERLILQYSKKFWTKGIKEPFSEFCIVAPDSVCTFFYDITPSNNKSSPTFLMTYISQSMLEKFSYDSQEIVSTCLKQLGKTFSKPPAPISWTFTDSKKECLPYGNYIKVGHGQKCYDDFAHDVDKKLYFSGAGTFRNVPNTVSGAYISGLREAVKLIKFFEI